MGAGLLTGYSCFEELNAVKRGEERAVALADPQSVTISGTATSLPRSGLSLDEGRFTDATGQVIMTAKHQSGRRIRHTIKLQKSAIVADPLVPSVNQNVSYSTHIVVDVPKNGVSNSDAIALANALVAWATSANITKLVGGES